MKQQRGRRQVQKSFRRLISVTLVALTALAISATPAAALKVSGDGYYSSFSFGVENPVTGIVVVDRVDADSGRVTVLVSGLLASDEYFIVGRSIGCNGTPNNGNRVFRATSLADVNGDIYLSYAYELKDVLVSSIWVGRTDGQGPTACSLSLNFEEIKLVGDWNGDGALGVITHELTHWGVAVEKRPNGRARISTALLLGNGDGNFRLRGVNKACGRTPTQTIFNIVLTDVLISGYFRSTVDMTQNQLDALRSVRITNLDTNEKFCMPLSIIGILVT
jgi:hypothetical protein